MIEEKLVFPDVSSTIHSEAFAQLDGSHLVGLRVLLDKLAKIKGKKWIGRPWERLLQRLSSSTATASLFSLHFAFHNEQTKDMTTPSSSPEELNIKVDFGGGLEILFDNKRSHTVSLPSRVPAAQTNNPTDPIVSPTGSNPYSDSPAEERPTDVSALIDHLKDNVLSDRKRAGLFAENGTVYVLLTVKVTHS